MCPAKIPGKPDREAQDLLQALDRLHAVDSGSATEPPALIDQSVRNMARRELQQGPPPIGGKLRWIAGLSTVSVALIALGLSMLQSPQVPAPAASPEKAKGIELEQRREDTQPLPPAQTDANYRSSALTAEQSVQSSLPEQSESALAAKSAADNTAISATGPATPAALDKQASELEKVARATEPALAAPSSAEAWLALANQLHDEGMHTEAREQLQALVKAYPDFPLPGWAIKLLLAEP